MVAHAYAMSGMSEQALVAAVQQRLMAMYSWLSAEHISAVVQGAHAQFVDCRVREFVPLLVERRARAELATASSSSAVTAERATARLA